MPGMTPSEFREALDELGLSQTEAARRLDVSLRSVQNWAGGTHEPPGPVRVLMRMWLRHPELLLETKEDR